MRKKCAKKVKEFLRLASMPGEKPISSIFELFLKFKISESIQI